MGAGEGGVSASGVLGLLIHLAFVFALVSWGRRIARERGTRAWWIASYVPIAGFCASMIGLLGTIAGLVRAFGAVAHADASHRAELLSQGIAEAMGWTAIGLGVALVCYLGSALAFLYGSYGPRPEARSP